MILGLAIALLGEVLGIVLLLLLFMGLSTKSLGLYSFTIILVFGLPLIPLTYGTYHAARKSWEQRHSPWVFFWVPWCLVVAAFLALFLYMPVAFISRAALSQ